MWGTFLSEPLRIVALVGRRPANQLMRRMPIPYRRSFPPRAMRQGGLRGISPNFSGLFPCRGQVAYVLLTSAPVAIRHIAMPMLPLDLHVLSLSLAFILSQDQTLRCVCSSFYSSCKKMTPTATGYSRSLKRNASLVAATGPRIPLGGRTGRSDSPVTRQQKRVV